jgi:hypothetical protein
MVVRSVRSQEKPRQNATVAPVLDLRETEDKVIAVPTPRLLAGCSPGACPSPSTTRRTAMSGTESTSRASAFQSVRITDMLKN